VARKSTVCWLKCDRTPCSSCDAPMVKRKPDNPAVRSTLLLGCARNQSAKALRVPNAYNRHINPMKMGSVILPAWQWLSLIATLYRLIGGLLIPNLPTTHYFPSAAHDTLSHYFITISNVCLVCAAIALVPYLYQRFLRRRFFKNQKPDISSIRDLSDKHFIYYCSEYFRKLGYMVDEHHYGASDKGFDLRLCNGNDFFVVRCIHKETRIAKETIDKFYQSVIASKTQGGIIVTSGCVSPDEIYRADDYGLNIIDGPNLSRFITTGEQPDYDPLACLINYSKSTCHRCFYPMDITPHYDKCADGKAYYRCMRYPICRATQVN